MPLHFVRVRRVDDHAVTATVGESAVQHMPGWEVIPDTGTAADADAPASERTQGDTTAAASKPSRKSAATVEKE